MNDKMTEHHPRQSGKRLVDRGCHDGISMNLEQSVNESAFVRWVACLWRAGTRAQSRCSDITTVTQEAQHRKCNESRTPRSNCHQTEILLWFPDRKAEAEKWILGSTRCNKGDADHTKGKERCLQPVKRWRVAYHEADRV